MKAAFHNLGCKVNAYETQSMEQMFAAAGYEIVDFETEPADIYIINTCSVTNIADRKSRQMLHRARKLNPHAVVVAAGCYVQAAADKVFEDDAVDIIVGNNKKIDMVAIVEEYLREKGRSQNVIDIAKTTEYENLSIDTVYGQTRAYIKVQDGCNQFCTYCIIPYTRGRIRSRSPEAVLDEVKKIAADGYREVVLTGIHLSSYGLDFEEDRKSSLIELIEAVNGVDGIERIRLGSLEPGIVTEEFAKRLAALEKICPHFHLSLQSGCDATLKRMNRKYTTAEYERGCGILREHFEEPAITTDVIVGFPGETEEEFRETKAFLWRIHFYEMHV
ncbi:MAG: tRNA (N(6)-L-threonylcarbamoyladenosine(37)-C(2))-methylthiotransferase MtaB, partial [Alistipes sp.]|nr:tRNA (N(6)-L-threonylcarbamoyladenosine(37)-C(2))-methylthiotransferase MtaB [Alistipes sp.]